MINHDAMMAITWFKRDLARNGLSAPLAMEFPAEAFDKLMDGLSASYGLSRATLDQRIKHGFDKATICGIEIKRVE